MTDTVKGKGKQQSTNSTASNKRSAIADGLQDAPNKRQKSAHSRTPGRNSPASDSSAGEPAGEPAEDREVLDLDPAHHSILELPDEAPESEGRKTNNKLTELSYYSKWSKEVKVKAKQVWTGLDEICLEKTKPKELALWRIADREFDQPPPSLLPDGEQVETARSGKITFEGNEHPNPNWGDAFCESFGKLLCCPAFKEEPHLLKYCIKLAMWFRLGEKDGRKKPELETYITRNERIISSVLRKLPESDIKRRTIQAIHEALDKEFGAADMEDLRSGGFLKYLENSVATFGTTTLDSPHICRRDLDAIAKAWDKYAGRNPRLQTVDQAFRPAPQGRGKAGDADPAKTFLRSKKKWIIAERLTTRLLDAETARDLVSRDADRSPAPGADVHIKRESSSPQREETFFSCRTSS